MIKNTAGQKVTLFAFDVVSGLPKTGDAANIAAYVAIDDGAVTALTDTSATEKSATNAKGEYLFDVSQAENNGTKLDFSGKSTTPNVVIVPQTIYTSVPNDWTADERKQIRDALGVDGLKTAAVGGDLQQLLSLLTGVRVVTVTGGGAGSEVSVFAEYNYNDRTWINAAGTWRDLTGATIALVHESSREEIPGTFVAVTPSGVNQTIRWDIDHDDIPLSLRALRRVILQATWMTGETVDDVKELWNGTLNIK